MDSQMTDALESDAVGAFAPDVDELGDAIPEINEAENLEDAIPSLPPAAEAIIPALPDQDSAPANQGPSPAYQETANEKNGAAPASAHAPAHKAAPAHTASHASTAKAPAHAPTAPAKPPVKHTQSAAGASPASPAARPRLAGRTTSQYMEMMRAHAAIPRWHAWIAHFFTWIALAGFGLSAGTFDNNAGASGLTGKFADASNLVLFVISFGSCGIGVAGMAYYYWVWRRNYPWLLQRIFIPGFSNGLAGAITTISSVFGAQNGAFTTGSYAALGASGALCVVCGLLAAVYGLYLMPRLKSQHQKMVAARRGSSASASSTAKRPVSTRATGAAQGGAAAHTEKATATGAKGAKKNAQAHRRMRGGWFNRAARLEGEAEGVDHDAHDFMDEGDNLESEAGDLMDNPLDALDIV